MSRLRFILPLLFFFGTIIGQVTTVGTIANGEGGSSVRAKLNTMTTWDTQINSNVDSISAHRTALNAHLDSIAAHRTVLTAHLDSITALRAAIVLNSVWNDSIAIHRTELDNLSDSIAAHLIRLDNAEDSIAAHLLRLDNAEDSINVHRTEIDDISDSIDIHRSELDNVSDSISVHRTELDNTTDSIAAHLLRLDNTDDSIAAHLIRLDNAEDSISAHRTEIDNGVDSIAVHRTELDNMSDSITQHRAEINNMGDSVTAHRTLLDNLSDSIDIHRVSLDAHGDTLDVHRTDINTTTTVASSASSSATAVSLNTVGVYGITITFDGDTMYVNDGTTTRKFLQVGSQSEDPNPPTVLSAEVGNVQDSIIYLTMSEALAADSIVASTAWSFTEAGVAFGIDTMDITGGDTLRIYLDSMVASSTALLLGYTRPGGTGDIQDANGQFLVAFSNLSVDNNVNCQETSALAWYRFENDATDETGNYDATATGGATYTGSYKVEGSYGGDLDGANRYWALPSMDRGTNTVISLWWYRLVTTGSGTLYATASNGIEIEFTFTANNVSYNVHTGSGPTTMTSDVVAFSAGEWTHLAVVLNSTSDAGKIYQNGEDITLSSTIDGSYATTSTARIGLDANGNGSPYIFIDDTRIYDVDGSSGDIANLYANPGVAVSMGGCGDPPVPSDSIEVLWEVDWDLFTPATTITTTQLAAHYPNYYSLGSSLGSEADYVDIVDIGAYNVLQSNYPQNHCCTECCPSNQDITNGGTGWDPRAYVTDASTYYRELYLSYEIYVESGFINPEAFKLPALGSSTTRTARIIVKEMAGENSSLNPNLYYSEYNTGYTDAPMHADNFVQAGLTTGTWHTVTLRYTWSSAAQVADGLVEMFIDNVFTGKKGVDLRLMDYGDPSGINMFDFSTFMGGDNVQYQSPQDQWIRYRGVKIWRYKPGITGIPYNDTQSGNDRVIYDVFQ